MMKKIFKRKKRMMKRKILPLHMSHLMNQSQMRKKKRKKNRKKG